MEVRRFAATALLVLGAVWLLGAGCGGAGGGRDITMDEPVGVERVFEKGDVLKYRLKADNQSGVKRTAYEQTVYSQTEIRTTNTFTEVGEDKVDMTMRFDYAVGSITVGDRVRPDETVSGLRGKELFFALDPNGEVESWTGLSGEAYLEAGAGQMAMLLYEVFPPLPDGPVTLGTTWKQDYDVPDITSAVDRDFIGETTYTVKGFKEKYQIPCIDIDRVTEFEFEGRAEQAGEVWLMSGSGSITGEALISIEDGYVVYGTTEVTLDLHGEGSSVASAAATGVIEMGIKSRLSMELME